jgi:hypothetical protein
MEDNMCMNELVRQILMNSETRKMIMRSICKIGRGIKRGFTNEINKESIAKERERYNIRRKEIQERREEREREIERRINIKKYGTDEEWVIEAYKRIEAEREEIEKAEREAKIERAKRERYYRETLSDKEKEEIRNKLCSSGNRETLEELKRRVEALKNNNMPF